MRSLPLALALLALTAASGCNKEEPEAQNIPIPGAEAPVAALPEPPAAAEDAGDTSDAGAAVAQPAPPSTVVAPVQQASIDGCCAALKAVAKSGKDKAAKQQAAQAAAVCPGIAALVKSGTTSRSAGLTQIRSALVGGSVPSECR